MNMFFFSDFRNVQYVYCISYINVATLLVEKVLSKSDEDVTGPRKKCFFYYCLSSFVNQNL